MMINSWVLSSLLSAYSLVLFLYVSKEDDPESDLLFGFCVSGFSEAPNRLHGCHNSSLNSHMASFVIDSAMGILVYFLHERLRKQLKGQTLNPQVTNHFLAMGTVIFAHGFLHLILSEMIDCYLHPSVQPPWLEAVGLLVFAVFAFLICFVILNLTFTGTPNAQRKSIILSIMFTGLAVQFAINTRSEWFLPALFSLSHPLSCAAALFSKSPIFTQTMGWTFLIASFMGILEMTQCATIYRSLGGHVLYDFWLHLTVILCLPPFAPPVTSLISEVTQD